LVLSSDFSWLKGLLATVGDTIFAEEFTAKLSGFNEIGSISATGYTGAVLSDGKGTAKLDLDKKAGTVNYMLAYSNVGSTPPQTGTVSQAHIHFGKSRDSGGILVFFCTNLTPPVGPPAPPKCPLNSGTVSGTWTKDDVLAIAGQNVKPGDFNALLQALKSDTAYANIHTTSSPPPGSTDTAFPAGEIRGQIRSDDEDHDHDNNQGHNH